ncbi:MAG TPA: diguanylate cyclase, partial [Pseudonocardia sp.]
MPAPPDLPPLMGFDEACRLVVDHLKREVPLAFWSVTRVDDGKQVYVCVRDDAYGTAPGGCYPWSESFCRHMVAGRAPQIAPDAMAVPEYAGTRAARELEIGAYIGVPIRNGDGSLYGTICGLDPQIAAESLRDHAPLLGLFATLLGQILHAENLQAEAADREAHLHWSAFHDDLTGLPNRALFFDRVGQALDRHAEDGLPVAVLLVDLDEFKAVNDTLGHAAGDELLALVAQRLQRAVRPGDTLARLSGDEFAVLLEDAADPTVVATRLADALGAPFVVAGRPLTISASVGVAALDPDEPAGVETVLGQADIAMYSAKRAGKGGVAVYDPLMTLPGTAALQLREPLRRAIAAGEVEAHFQPIVDLDAGTVTGFEALARWRHEGRAVEPDVFVPVAVRTGLASALTDHMLDVACAQAARWSAELGHRDLRVSVNVSPQSLGDPGLPDRVAQHLRHHGLGPGQ